MSNELAKFLGSRRRHKTDVKIARQLAISRKKGSSHPLYDKQPHRLAKHRAMDCGRPGCAMCGNPRHIHKHSLTAQEKRLFQDTEALRHRHPNGSNQPKDSL